MKSVIGLMATRPRMTAMQLVSLPCIVRQSRPLDALVIVADSRSLRAPERETVCTLLPGLTVIFLDNTHIPGAAGTWNTGLEYIQERWPDSYVAILDDDDVWDPDHLRVCCDVAHSEGLPDVVLSGIRTSTRDEVFATQMDWPPTVDDFLAGNPGWQGSNTFALASVLKAAGNFTDGLMSANDRDLAVRLLMLDGLRLARTNRFTVTWHLGLFPDALSLLGIAKAQGLRSFHQLHGHRMSPDVESAFFRRCEELFGLSREELV